MELFHVQDNEIISEPYDSMDDIRNELPCVCGIVI